MSFQPADSLRSRTYLGLITAQFLAAFNDQAIHASAMFFAISQDFMSEANAISLMPILFYLPWAIFCTVAGYFADRYSKRDSLVFWKVAEIGISLVALLGFYLGSVHHTALGPVLVLACVFLMGTHSAFFVPAKYGCMPEILQPHLLSRANGILEGLSFFAVILGTVCGGILSWEFKGQESYIGLTLFGLSLLGVAASLLIRRMPAANPNRPFFVGRAELKTAAASAPPILGELKAVWIALYHLYRPLGASLKVFWRSRPLRLTLLGIAFFTFLVAYMRGSVYMHGESQVPHWSEFRTSLVVGSTALGVGLGGVLAGFFSGGKVELGLVPLGAVGMTIASVLAAVTLFWLPGLVACIILIGLFAGFYTLPMFTLMQHRAPKKSKGELIAASNFVNVLGAILASLLFKGLVILAETSGVAPLVPGEVVAHGTLLETDHPHSRIVRVKIRKEDGQEIEIKRADQPNADDPRNADIELEGIGIDKGSDVALIRYPMRNRFKYVVQDGDDPTQAIYDREAIPQLLFLGAAVITVLIMAALCWQLPNFFLRTLLWLRSLGKYRLEVVGVNNLPAEGPVILATDAAHLEACLQVLTATDRSTRFALVDQVEVDRLPSRLLRLFASGALVGEYRAADKDAGALERVIGPAARELTNGNVLALAIGGEARHDLTDELLAQLRQRQAATLLPVYHGVDASKVVDGKGTVVVRVVIGAPLPPTTPAGLIRKEIDRLGEWASRHREEDAPPDTTAGIPGAAAASPTATAATPPGPPSSR